MSRKNRARNDNLYKAILELQNIEEAKNFFDDLCTVKELEAMEQRYQVAMHLRNGLNYNEILQKTGSSSATISRVNRSLQYGTGGYEVIMARLDEKELYVFYFKRNMLGRLIQIFNNRLKNHCCKGSRYSFVLGCCRGRSR